MKTSRLRLVLVGLVLVLSLGGSAGALAHPFAASGLTSAQSRYLSAAEKGVTLAGRYWSNRKFHWYNSILKDPKPYPQASIWDAVPLFESVDDIAIASPTATHKQAVTSFANHAEKYFDPNVVPGPGMSTRTPAYAPYPNSHNNQKTFFDDGRADVGLIDGRETETEVRRLLPARDDLRPLYLNTQGLRVGKSGAVLKIQEKEKVVQEVRLGEICQLPQGRRRSHGTTVSDMRRLCHPRRASARRVPHRAARRSPAPRSGYRGPRPVPAPAA